MQRLKHTLPFVLLFGVNAAVADSFGSSQPPVSSARSVSSAPVGAPVTLRGEIAGQQSPGRYVFSDNTGSVLVSVNNSAIGGPIEAGTPVEIVGQIDSKSRGRAEIDARSVTVLASNSLPSSPDSMNPIHGGGGYQHFESD